MESVSEAVDDDNESADNVDEVPSAACDDVNSDREDFGALCVVN